MMEQEYINKNLYRVSEEDFDKAITNDFIGDDFIEQLEWAMLMTRNAKFSQFKAGNHLAPVTRNTFDKCYLMNNGLKKDLKFLAPQTGYQASPEIFQNLNIKGMMITDTIQMYKVKDITADRFKLKIKEPYAYEISFAIYKKDDEDFYCAKEGFGVKKDFFNIDYSRIPEIRKRLELIQKECDKFHLTAKYVEEIKALNKEVHNMTTNKPVPYSLIPGYVANAGSDYYESDWAQEISNKIAMSYQMALSFYYEWSIYVREPDNIGFVIPIDPHILKDIYTTSILKFDSSKRMMQFVKDHYRRKRASETDDYSVYIHRYLRGENKFDYMGFSAEIIPPRYDLNRAKTRKKITDTLCDD